MASEDKKPSDDQLQEFRDSGRESLELQVFSPAPIYDDLEIAKLATELALFVRATRRRRSAGGHNAGR